MTANRSFEAAARGYGAAYRRAMVRRSAVRWVPAGAVLAAVPGLVPGTEAPGFLVLSAAFLVLAPLAAALAAIRRHRDPAPALSWLDREIDGRQEIPAAWEWRRRETPLADLVRSSGLRLLRSRGPQPPVPTAGPVSILVAVLSTGLLVLLLMAGFFLNEPEGQTSTEERGAELESWAESWARSDDGSAQRENRDLAERMEELGRRMADGSMGERRSQRALRELEDEIAERREALIRDALADTLVDDLNVDPDVAEMFRVRQKRLPADALDELGRAAAGSDSLSRMGRDLLDELLNDPNLRDRRGDGTQELGEELTETLKDALGLDDPRFDELDRAEERSRAARDEESDPEGDDGEAEAPGSDRPAPSGTDSAPGGAGEESADPDGRQPLEEGSGGSGRGSAAVEDRTEAASSVPAFPKQDRLDLPSESDRSGSWRTVIRAYAEADELAAAPDAVPTDAWREEAESVIRRDDIPMQTRDIVRDYFLALEEGPTTTGDEENINE